MNLHKAITNTNIRSRIFNQLEDKVGRKPQDKMWPLVVAPVDAAIWVPLQMNIWDQIYQDT